MRVSCAWCKKDMGEKPGGGHSISHGICADCIPIVESGEYEAPAPSLPTSPVAVPMLTMGVVCVLASGALPFPIYAVSLVAGVVALVVGVGLVGERE